ncbi:DUF4270 family protein [Flaviaesturariibacter flavus]|uniref:DUF4270 family protein n=1 Tax=Flaviaesturariibacter flavus TaxID=2502780 RepID=A0A4R1BNQ0_9BACT|nr:DUF4270 family protein [Flaviaesturariibacter flavus]TCJ19223.1 DUF4270 family protein [Flaviaesturariibacter flavus]
MKNYRRLLLGTAMVLTFGIGIESCRKINEATDLGGGLIPAVDNINTFADTLDVNIANEDWSDSTVLYSNDELALGTISNDPEFGNSKANIYFNFGPKAFDVYPFYNKDSLVSATTPGVLYDSAFLNIGYTSIYGDSAIEQGVKLYEIAANSGFNDSSYYSTKAPDFAVNGSELGAVSYTPGKLKDSQRIIRRRDTTFVTGTLRIRLNDANGRNFVNRLINADPSLVYGDRASFFRNFPGLALRTDETRGNAFTYFNLVDTLRTKLTVYYTTKRDGITDTTSVNFYHGVFGGGFVNTGAGVKPRGSQANVIRRRNNGNGGNWLTYLNSGLQDRVFVQSDPGSQTIITIPGLTGYSNRVIHRAELIATRLHTVNEDRLAAPPFLYLTRTTTGRDTLTIADDSLSVNPSTGAIAASLFGGALQGDDTYRFNISRHVQNIVQGRAPNTKLKLFAPFRYTVADNRFSGRTRTFNIVPRIGYGRVVLAGPTNANPQVRMRVRVVWSRI